MDGDFLSQTFSFLRSNDLIYGPAVKSYLMGKKPPPFDLLYWNSDSTNLPGKMALEYLEKFYKNNDFSKGKLEVLGEKVNLEQISQPIIVIGTFKDHIAPWKSSFNGLSKTSGEKVFILAGSGHIAGLDEWGTIQINLRQSCHVCSGRGYNLTELGQELWKLYKPMVQNLISEALQNKSE